jgi:hypothetical protein
MKGTFILIGILSLSNVALAEELFKKRSVFSQYESVAEKNQIASEKNTIGGYPMVKIGADMRILFTKVTFSTGAVVPMGRAFMFAHRDKKFLFAVDVTGNLEQTSSPDWKDEPCKREDFLWKRSLGKSFTSVNCVSINHLVNYFVKPTGELQQMLVLAKDEGIDVSPTVIRVTFTRYAPNTRRLVYVVDINPEHYGIARDSTGVWGANEWHKNFISRDQKKVDFIENLKKWAVDVQDRMDNAFDKDTRAFSELKRVDDYLTAAVK